MLTGCLYVVVLRRPEWLQVKDLSMTESIEMAEQHIESKIIVYERLSESSSEDDPSADERPNVDIDTTKITRDEASRHFIESSKPSSESLKSRVSRIRLEIAKLSDDDVTLESEELLAELTNTLEKIRKPPKENNETHMPPQDSNSSDLTSSSEFASLESRVASLEACIGASARSYRNRPVNIVERLNTIQRALDIFASTSENVASSKSEAISRSQTPEKGDLVMPDKIGILYERLQEVDQIVTIIPSLVSRLQTLRYFHAESIGSITRQKDMEKSLASISSDVQSWREALESLEGRVGDYIKISNSNIEKLKKR